MKNLLLTAVVMLMSASLFAQKTKVINDPYYEFKNSGITNISRIELSSKETRVYVHSVFLPNWWVTFDKHGTITDCDSKKEYKVQGIEGAKFKERVFMKAPGDTTIVLIYPPFDKGTKKINYQNSVFGISLDEDLAGMKPHHSVPKEVDEWINTELAKCTKAPLDDFESEDFFCEEKGRLIGYIKGYSPKSDVTTGMLYLSNYLTREDYPLVIEIEPDGRFDVEIPLISPIYTYARVGNHSIQFYLEPGQTLGMILDWEECLEADRLRDRRYKFKNIAYKGKIAKTNYELMRYTFEEELVNAVRLRRLKNKMTFDEKVARIEEQTNIELGKLENYKDSWQKSEKSTAILENKIILKHATDMFDLSMRRRFEARKDTANKELQKVLPNSFYSFLSDVPLGEQALFVNNEFKTFINRYEYSSLVTKYRNELPKKYPLKTSLYKYLLDNEKLLSKEDKEFSELAEKKDKTDEEMEQLKDMQLNFSVLKERYSKSYSEWQKMASAHYNSLGNKIWDIAEKEIANEYGIENNLSLEVARVRSLKYKFKNIDKEAAQQLWNDLKKGINHPYLLAAGDKLYEKSFGENANVAYELPQGPATDIFNKIIAPHKGKVLFVDFWATSCGPCVSGIKRMKETRKQYEGDSDIDFVFITDERSTPEKKYNEFVKNQELKNTYRISANDYLYLRQLFKFNGIPRYVVIDKEGKVMDDNFNMYNFKGELTKILESQSNELGQK